MSLATLLLWAGAACTLVLPLRWAICALFLVVHIDLSGPEFASASTVGFENGIKIGLIPLVLLARTSHLATPLPAWFPSKWWNVFLAFVCIAAAWSVFPLSAFKLVVYMIAWTMIFIVLWRCCSAEIINSDVGIVAVIGGMLLGATQTWLLGNVFGTEDGRFTSFSAPQSFAASMAVCFALLLFRALPPGTLPPAVRVVAIVAAVLGVVLTESRYVAVGTVIAFGIWVYYRKPRGRLKPRTSRSLWSVAVLAVAGWFVLQNVELPAESRLGQLQDAILARSSLSEIGTFAFRLEMYGYIIDEVKDGSPIATVIGHGTSSGATVALLNYDQFSGTEMDANRVLHNEYLRVLYEWGIAGLAVFLAFLAGMLRGLFRRREAPTVRAALAISPLLLIGLGIENVFAGSASPSGIAFSLAFAAAVAASARREPVRTVAC